MKSLPFFCSAAVLLSGVSNLYAFQYEGINYDILDENTVTIGSNAYVSGDIVIPEEVVDESDGKVYTVTEISKQAFGLSSINSIVLPNTITFIDRVAFSNSTLKTIKLPDQLETIGFGCFSGCSNLESIEIPNSVKVLGAVSPLTGFGGGVFFDCPVLKYVKLPDGLEAIETTTFKSCPSLESIDIPKSVKMIDSQAFADCPSLKAVEIPEGVTSIAQSAFLGCSSLSSVTIPEGVTEIGKGAFLWCYALQHVEFPSTLVTIGGQAFSCCGLLEIDIPNSVEHIVSDAFSGSSAVKTITLGEGVRRIGASSLQVWTVDMNNNPYWALTDIYCKGSVPPEFYHEVILHEPEHDFFFDSDFPEEYKEVFFSEVTLHVPADALDSYRNAEQWGLFKNIETFETGGVEDSVSDSGISFDGAKVSVAAGAGIEVYSLTGVQVLRSSNSELNVEQLPSGVYVVKSGNNVAKIAK